MKIVLNLFVAINLFLATIDAVEAYDPNWKSLDSRPIPLWYDDSKIGIFMHWGVYSVPSVQGAWFWYNWKGPAPKPNIVRFMQDNYKPGFTYADFAPQFTAEFFDPKEWAALIKASGAKYYVPTSKHHEGYTLWPSAYAWNWNSQDVGPGKNLLGELRKAILEIGDVHFGLYFSQFEWFNPLYQADSENHHRTSKYVDMVSYPQMLELVNGYEPDVIWSDGDWEALPEYWKSQKFLAWLYTNSTVKDRVVVNDRWGIGTGGKHGDFFNYADKYNPGFLLPHKWENAMTVDRKAWQFRRKMSAADVLTLNELLTTIVSTISCGGNILVDVGPTHYGRIVPILEERLLEMGAWLKVNGEAVYGSKPWIYQNDTVANHVWYTSKVRNDTGLNPRRIANPQITWNTIVYAFLLEWPVSGSLKLGSVHPTDTTKISLIGYPGREARIPFKSYKSGIVMDLTHLNWIKFPNTAAWVFKMEFLANSSRDPLESASKYWKTVPKRNIDFN